MDYFGSLKDVFGLEYDHAERAEAKAISQKVKDKMKGKNLFIGIFTANDYRIELYNLKMNLPIVNYGKKYLFSEGSSDWIIQESGYALATDMHLLFLIERGVNVNAGLQGDLEFVEFERENPSECFKKINEILGSLSVESSSTMATVTSLSVHEIKESDIDKEQISEESSKNTESNYKEFIAVHTSLRNLILKDKNIANAEKKLDDIIEKFKNDKLLSSFYWKSQFYRFKLDAGFPEALSELEKTSEANPDDIFSLSVLVNAYKKYGQYSKAAEQLLRKSKIVTRTINERIGSLGAAAESYALDKRFDVAYDIILQEFTHKELYMDNLYFLYKHLSQVAKIQENNNLFTAFAEKALELFPTDYDLRFSLAYLYGEKGNDKNSLEHYKFLCENNPTGGSWNNLGVNYDRVDIKGKAIYSFKEAADKYEETLAMSNIAKGFLNEGFLKEASDILKIARSKEGYNEDVDTVITRLNEMKRNEDKSLTSILESTVPEKIFKVTFAEAYISPLKGDITGKWSTRHGEIPIRMNGNKIYGETEEKFRTLEKLMALKRTGEYGVGGEINETPDSKRKIVITGKINNRSIEFQLQIKITSLGTTLLTSGEQEFTYDGLMYISANTQIINVMEWEKGKNKVEFYEMKKLQ